MRLCDHILTERGCSLPKTKNAFRKALSQSKLTCCHRCPKRQICGTPEAVCPNHRQGSLVNSELKTVGRMVQHIQWIQWSIGFRLAHTLLSWFCFCRRQSFFFVFLSVCILKQNPGVTFGGRVCGWTPDDFEGGDSWGGIRWQTLQCHPSTAVRGVVWKKRLWWMMDVF